MPIHPPTSRSSPDSKEIPAFAGTRYENIYLGLAALFITSLVACNLIFQKFFVLDIPLPGGATYRFEQSVGILAYPFTFLVTDILSEAYGAKRANHVVSAGLVASIFVLVLIEVADTVPSTSFGIGDHVFHQVFAVSKIGIFASMCAYLSAQFLDIRIFYLWRKKTKGRHLWLRNNASTFLSQIVDTSIVLLIYAVFEVAGIQWSRLSDLILSGVLFKWCFAVFDTPLFYFAIYCLRASR